MKKKDHYNGIFGVNSYDQYAPFSDLESKIQAASIIEKHLDLQWEDHLADIGCGTGSFTQLFIEKTKLPIDCVDPFDMIDALPENPKLIKFQMDANEYFEKKNEKKNQPTKILFKGCWHHLNHEEILNHLSQFKNGVQFCIWRRPQNSNHLPFPKGHHWNFKGCSIEELVTEIQKFGFEAKFTTKIFVTKYKKEHYTHILKQKFWSNLANITDFEVDEFMKTFKKTDEIRFEDRIQILVGIKKN
jgi:hypothetical protein